MRIAFNVDDTPALFERNWATREASLTVGDQRKQLESFWKGLFNLEFETTRYWQCDVLNHSIVVEKTRPTVFPEFRPQTYRVLVDGTVVARLLGVIIPILPASSETKKEKTYCGAQERQYGVNGAIRHHHSSGGVLMARFNSGVNRLFPWLRWFLRVVPAVCGRSSRG